MSRSMLLSFVPFWIVGQASREELEGRMHAFGWGDELKLELGLSLEACNPLRQGLQLELVAV